MQFVIATPDSELAFPETPITIRSNAHIIWPFRLNLGGGVVLEAATAQLICGINEEQLCTLFFAETPGVSASFKFLDGTERTIQPGRDVAIRTKSTERELRVVLLNEADSLALWKGQLAGRDRVVLSQADVTFDDDAIELRAEDPKLLTALVYPPLDDSPQRDGVFGQARVEAAPREWYEVQLEQTQQAGAPREVPIGRNKVAKAPRDRDFAAAAVWKLSLPDDFDPASIDAILRIDYHGDVARLKIGGKLVMDDFYNGRPLEVGLSRFAAELLKHDAVTLEILPPPGQGSNLLAFPVDRWEAISTPVSRTSAEVSWASNSVG